MRVGVVGVREITKSKLLTLMSKTRLLSQSEKAQVDRGCPGLTCLYQGLSLARWPELARGTRAYLRLEDAMRRNCPEGRENSVFIKQAWWTSGIPPAPEPKTGEVPLSSVTRQARMVHLQFTQSIFKRSRLTSGSTIGSTVSLESHLANEGISVAFTAAA